MKIIPAIDILDGKCVRLSQGHYESRQIYNESPLEVALQLEANGITNVHIVDLDGAVQNNIVNHHILEEIATRTKLIIDFGGGLKSDTAIQTAFECGASQVTLGSIAVKDRDKTLEWLDTYGATKIILGADFREDKIATSGWTHTSDQSVLQFISSYAQAGMKTCICTDISKDGMLEGPSIEMYQAIMTNTNIDLIASGGVSSLDDIQNLQKIGCSGVIIGKAMYEGKISLKEISELC